MKARGYGYVLDRTYLGSASMVVGSYRRTYYSYAKSDRNYPALPYMEALYNDRK